MANGDISLQIPARDGNGIATPYANPSPPIGGLVLSNQDEEGGYSRRDLNWALITEHSQWGVEAIGGVGWLNRYAFDVAFLYDLDVIAQLRALLLWQDLEYKRGRDGALLLTDEILWTDALPAGDFPATRSLVSSRSPSWAPGYVHGYCRYLVKHIPTEDSLRIVGQFLSTGKEAQVLAVSFEEVRGELV